MLDQDGTLIVFRNSGDPLPTPPTPPASPAPVSAPGTSQSERQAEIDRIFANPNRSQAESEHAVELLRQSLGEAGRQIMFQTGTPPPPLDAVLSSDQTVPAEVAPVPTEASVLNTMAAESLVAAAPGILEQIGVGGAPEQVQAIVASLVPRPDGFPMRLEDELQHHPEDVRNELEELHTLGWNALKGAHGFPMSAIAVEEKHGFRYAPRVFALCVELGAIVRERQEAEVLRLQAERPGSRRLNDPGQRR
jgi:hypothetical protein